MVLADLLLRARYKVKDCNYPFIFSATKGSFDLRLQNYRVLNALNLLLSIKLWQYFSGILGYRGRDLIHCAKLLLCCDNL